MNSSKENAATSNPDSEQLPTLGPEIDLFITHQESVSHGFMLATIIALQDVHKKARDALSKFELDHCEIEDKDGERQVSVPGDKYQEWKRLRKKDHVLTLSLINFPRSLLVSLVSHFDAYVGRL